MAQCEHELNMGTVRSKVDRYDSFNMPYWGRTENAINSVCLIRIQLDYNLCKINVCSKRCLKVISSGF